MNMIVRAVCLAVILILELSLPTYAQNEPPNTIWGNLSNVSAPNQAYTPPQVTAGGFTGNSTCGFSQNLVASNTPTAGGFSTTSMQLYNAQIIVLCQSPDMVNGVGPSASSQAILVRNIYPNNINPAQGVAVLPWTGTLCPNAACTSTPTASGGNDPGSPCAGQGVPTNCHLFIVANLASPPNYGVNNVSWGVVLSSRGCAEGPSGVVQTFYPWFACLMWNLTAGAPSAGDDYFKFVDAKYQHRQERLGHGTSPYNAVIFDHTLLRSGMSGGVWQPFNPGSPADAAGQTSSPDVADIIVLLRNTTGSPSACEVADTQYSPSLTDREQNGGTSGDTLEFSLFPATGAAWWWSNATGCTVQLKAWDDIYP